MDAAILDYSHAETDTKRIYLAANATTLAAPQSVWVRRFLRNAFAHSQEPQRFYVYFSAHGSAGVSILVDPNIVLSVPIQTWVGSATEAHETALLSERVLARDWLRPEEDEAWRDLQRET